MERKAAGDSTAAWPELAEAQRIRLPRRRYDHDPSGTLAAFSDRLFLRRDIQSCRLAYRVTRAGFSKSETASLRANRCVVGSALLFRKTYLLRYFPGSTSARRITSAELVPI